MNNSPENEIISTPVPVDSVESYIDPNKALWQKRGEGGKAPDESETVQVEQVLPDPPGIDDRLVYPTEVKPATVSPEILKTEPEIPVESSESDPGEAIEKLFEVSAQESRLSPEILRRISSINGGSFLRKVVNGESEVKVVEPVVETKIETPVQNFGSARLIRKGFEPNFSTVAVEAVGELPEPDPEPDEIPVVETVTASPKTPEANSEFIHVVVAGENLEEILSNITKQ